MTASLLATAVVAFLGTTIDDLIILTALFLARRTTGRPAQGTVVGSSAASIAAPEAWAVPAVAEPRVHATVHW
jgi:cadmium resistance protein CadD (predicted permease)